MCSVLFSICSLRVQKRNLINAVMQASKMVAVSLLLLLWVPAAMAAPLFEDDSVLTVVLQGPWSKTLGDNDKDPTSLLYKLTVEGTDVDVGVRPRGASRRSVCKVPPLRLKFSEPSPRSVFVGPFMGQDKLKLVTHCNTSKKAEQNVLEEYAAYRILNLITHASFRVRLMKINYIDAEQPQRQPPTKWGFVIEDVDQLATRLGGAHVEPRFAPKSSLGQRHATQVGLFQYLIGNTDFSLTNRRPRSACCHNAKLIERPEYLLSIPYDFDQAGLVDAAYAGGNPVYAAADVRRRVYFGVCTSLDELQASLQTFQDQRVAILRLLEEIPGMADITRRRAVKYIEKFYQRMDKKGVAPLHRRCRSE